MIKVDLSQAKLAESMDAYTKQVASIHDMIHNKTGKGNDTNHLCWKYFLI